MAASGPFTATDSFSVIFDISKNFFVYFGQYLSYNLVDVGFQVFQGFGCVDTILDVTIQKNNNTYN